VALVVQPPPFTLSITQSPQSVQEGQSATFTISALGSPGFTGQIALGWYNPAQPGISSFECAAGQQVTFFNVSSLTPIYAGQQEAAILVTSNVAHLTQALPCNFSISASSGGITYILNGELDVTPVAGFTLTLNQPGGPPSVAPPSSGTVSANYPINVTTQNGYSGTVNFTAAFTGNPVPQGVSFYSIGSVYISSPGGSGSTTVTANVPPGVAAGQYRLTITGADSTGVPHFVYGILNIQQGADFTLSVSPSPQSVAQGGSASYTISVVPGPAGFNGTVTLNMGAITGGVSASLNVATISANSPATLTLNVSSTAALGILPATILGTAGPLIASTSAVLNVVAAAPASMISPTSGALLPNPAATFMWDAGSGVSEYQFALGSSPGGSDYYFANTGFNRSSTVSISSNGQALYGTLSSLIGGTWQSRAYTFSTASSTRPTGSFQLTAESAVTSAPSPNYVALNNDQPTLIGHLYWCIGTTYNGSCISALPAADITSCSLSSNPGISTPSISRPSQSDPSSVYSFDISVAVNYTTPPGTPNLTCTDTWGDMANLTGAFAIDDATPQINAVVQDQPAPDGSFYMTVYGTNFGPSQGSVSVCATGADPCGSSDITVVQNAPYSYWSDNQVNVLLVPSPGSSDLYDLQLTSLGESGNGFVAAPQTSSKSNRGTVNQVLNQLRQNLALAAASALVTNLQRAASAPAAPVPTYLKLASECWAPNVPPDSLAYTLEVTYQILDSTQQPMSGAPLAGISVSETLYQKTGSLVNNANGTWVYGAQDGIEEDGTLKDYLSAGGIPPLTNPTGSALQVFTATGFLPNGLPLVAQPLQVIGFGPTTPVLSNIYGQSNVTINGYGLGTDPKAQCQ